MQFIEPIRTPDADPDEPPRNWRRASVRELLTDAEEQFAQELVKHANQTRAYRVVFATSPDTTNKTCALMGARYARKPKIAARVEEIREEMRAAILTKGGMTAEELLYKYLLMLNADPNELIGLRIGCCRHCYGDGHLYQWKLHEYTAALEKWEALPRGVQELTPMPAVGGGFDFDQTAEPNPECPACMGEGHERVVARDTTQLSPGARLLYQGVKQTRNGLEIQIADRQKVLEAIGRMMGAFKDGPNKPLQLAIAAVVDNSDPMAAQAAYEQMIAAGGAFG